MLTRPGLFTNAMLKDLITTTHATKKIQRSDSKIPLAQPRWAGHVTRMSESLSKKNVYSGDQMKHIPSPGKRLHMNKQTDTVSSEKKEQIIRNYLMVFVCIWSLFAECINLSWC